MTLEAPDHYGGKPIPEDAIEIALAAEMKNGNEGEALSLDSFIYVPSVKLYFAKERTLFYHDWDDTHKKLHEQKLRMPTIPQFVEFLKYLRADPTAENTRVYDEITGKRDPVRAEWFDAKFYYKDDEVWVAYNHIVNLKGDLVAQDHEKVEGHLMQDEDSKLSLEHWLDNPTKQGLPQENSEQGDLLYWPPSMDRVARFHTSSSFSILNCDTYPGGSSSVIGVFACAEKPGEKQ